MNTILRLAAPALLALASASAALALEVNITPTLSSVETLHNGQRITIRRNQDRRNRIKPLFSYTSRSCPPFCIHPIKAAPGVETYGELEVLEVLARIGRGDDSVLVVDSRTAQWPQRGMIPGAVNIPWTEFEIESPEELFKDVLAPRFGVRKSGDGLDYSEARTVVFYCNGPWCSQSTNAIRALMEIGYPPKKIKWYRGGMQDWESMGLSTVTSP